MTKDMALLGAAVIAMLAGFGGGRGVLVEKSGTLIAVAAPCDVTCQAKHWPHVLSGTPSDRIIRMRSLERCTYRQIPGESWVQYYWGAGIGWAPLDEKDGAMENPDYEVGADFIFSDRHPVYEDLARIRASGCPLLLQTSYPAFRAPELGTED